MMMETRYILVLIPMIASICGSVVYARNPPYASLCESDQDCGQTSTKCFKDYERCNVGMCGCVYGVSDHGQCAVKREGDSCSTRSECPRGLDCSGRRCVCTGTLTDDKLHCLKSREVLLGRGCTSDQTCLHKTDGNEYVSSDISCHYGMCTCRLGLKQDGSTCRRLQPEQHGCITNADCSGDSLCRANQCVCPSGYKVVTHGPRKCGKNNAMTNLAEGQSCDEIINKNRFCALGLNCVTCGQQSGYKCRKFKSSRPKAVSLAADRTHHPVLALSLVSLIVTLLIL